MLLRTLLSKRVIVTSCADSSLLSFARCTNSSLGILEDHFQSHLYAPDSLPFPSNHHFGFLLVDEAAQASEAEICVPLAVVSPHPSSLKSSTPTPHITICGDSRQLGPRIESEHCRNHDMDVSLLERLFGRDLYRENPFARGNLRRAAPHSLHQTISTPFCNLTINYRSHPAILMIPSTLVRTMVLSTRWPGYIDSLMPFIRTCPRPLSSSTTTHSLQVPRHLQYQHR